MAWLVAVACSSCAPRAEPSRGGDGNKPAPAFSDSSATTTATATTPAAAPDFTFVNFSRFNLHAIYLSPHDSPGWEENVLGRDQLLDGAFVKIRFNPAEQAVKWDLRVEDEKGNHAEWKNLDLREISLITLRFRNGAVLAEVE